LPSFQRWWIRATSTSALLPPTSFEPPVEWTADWLEWAERKRLLQVKGRSATKPGSLLRRQSPTGTFAERDEALPGLFEVDLVAHDGGDTRGRFC